MALTDNLVAYYKLNNTVNDELSTYNLTLDGATYSASWKLDWCYDFDGTNDRIYTASNLGINGGSAVSIAWWINVDSSDGWSGKTVVHLSTTTGNNFFAIIYDKSTWSGGTNKLIFWRNRDTVGSERAFYTVTLSAGTWYHIMLTYDWSTVRWYLNGAEVTSISSSWAGGSSDAGNYFTIGKYQTSTQWFDGRIDEVWVRNKKVTDAEALELYNWWAGLSYPFITDDGSFLPFLSF